MHMHAQNMLPEQIFFPLREILLLFAVNSILRSCWKDRELPPCTGATEARS